MLLRLLHPRVSDSINALISTSLHSADNCIRTHARAALQAFLGAG